MECRRWIVENTSLVTTFIVINGSPTEVIKIEKGLRQEDLYLHPFFLIISEGLGGVIREAMDKGIFNSIIMGKEEILISHL